jgi:hypothetical protein
MVELLVALLFTSLLMAGMATVFKTSLSTFYTSGEKLSSLRRNRLALDLLADDLNNAGMYLVDPSSPPTVSSTNQAFYITPSDASAWTGTGVTQGGDQVFFYMDDPLPFEGSLFKAGTSSAAIRTAAEQVQDEVQDVAADHTYTIECGDEAYAKLVASGMYFILRDQFHPFYVSGTPTLDGSKVTVVAGADPNTQFTGRGSSDAPSLGRPLSNVGVVFMRPAQMVRYSIQMRQLDPNSAVGIPCLVRDQGNYATTGFTASGASQIIAENVTGFRAYLSADSGQHWVGGSAYDNHTWADLRTAIDNQLATIGRPGFTSTQGKDDWFRSIPVVLRLDVTTRTATQRGDYATGATPALAYKEQTQSVVLLPRHFGLSMQ